MSSAISHPSGNPSLFKRVLLAGLVFQSVAIGGAYATGRETVEYAAKFGTLGWMSVLGTFALLAVFAYLVFELCRKFRVFEYRGLLKLLIGPFYWVYDFLYLLLGVTIIGVLISAAGSIMADTLSVPVWITSVGLVAIVAVVLFFGQAVVERFNSTGTVLLTVGYVLFAVLVLTVKGDDLVANFRDSAPPLDPDSTAWSSISSGLIYGSLYLCIFPAAMPVMRFARARKDSFWSAINLGWLIALPLFLTYFAVMAFYPDPAVLDAQIPWLRMLSDYGPWVVIVFGLLVGWTLLATAVGLVQGALNRVSVNLEDFGRKPLTRKGNAVTAAVTLIVAIVISQAGIVDLVAKGYTAGAWGMLIVFGLPLLTRGVWLIVKGAPATGNTGDGGNTGDTASPGAEQTSEGMR
ncbi:YkvI family membrane protein [Prauserella endophytica]|uniref:Membrane protein YkvI n=1 Tax=Prauserella endophytica TaxID=1592324 RepID=A0ABY2RXY2_9PSEU|nr:hypothetical protein [Prauserella endophytica]TKG64929.1 hypothetical protein FCN18_28220 [Prauserella endophytica]